MVKFVCLQGKQLSELNTDPWWDTSTLSTGCRHEERVVGSCHSYMITVKPAANSGGGALTLEEQTVVMQCSRLENLIGAVAVALSPSEGLGALVGGSAVHPLTGVAIPVVASSSFHGAVNPELGQLHLQLCVENQLPITSTFKLDGRVAEGHGAYDGLSRGEAAILIKQELEQKGTYRGEEDTEEEVLLSRLALNHI